MTTRQETAQYVIAETFKITGRGLVFAGHITDGVISIGDTIEFVAKNKLYQRKIIGLEIVRKLQPSKVNAGLLIECENEEEIDKLRVWYPNNCLATVSK